MSVKIFISYAHEDENLLKKLKMHLKPLQRQGLIEVWHDLDISAGTEWEQEINKHLNEANIILLLISPDFMDSDYCYSKEMKRASERHERGEAVVIPIILRPVLWQEAPFSKLQALPKDGTPITSSANSVDNALFDVVTSLQQTIKKISSKSYDALPPEKSYSTMLEPDFVHYYSLSENFVGRIYERRMLTKWLSEGKEAILFLTALGGMGKSALAWVWLLHDTLGSTLPGFYDNTTKDSSSDIPGSSSLEGVLWWSFYEPESHFTAFLDEALVYVTNGSINLGTLNSTDDKVIALINLLQHHRFLFILDGFERELRAYGNLSAPYHENSVNEDTYGNFRACINPHVADFLRRVAALPLKSRVLITSRLFPQELDGLMGCRREDLKPLDPEDAINFMQAMGVSGTRAEIQAVCEHYNYYPLMLRLLAGLIRTDPVNPGSIELATEYYSNSLLVQKEQHILSLAYEALLPLRQLLLSRLAAFRSTVEYQTVQVVSPFRSANELRDALRDLLERGLLLSNQQRATYDLHPIVREYAYDRLLDKKAVHSRLRDYFTSIPVPNHPQSLRDLGPVFELYHHTIGAGRYNEAWDLYDSRLRTVLYYQLGEFELDLQLLEALPLKSDGSPSLSTLSAQVWNFLYRAMNHERLGRANKAVELTEKAIRLARGKDNTLLASALIPRSMSLCDLGQLQKASKAVIEAVSVFDILRDLNWQGISHRSYARILMYCGNFTQSLEEFKTAERAFDQDVPSGMDVGHCALFTHRAQLHLLEHKPSQALQFAQQAKERCQLISYKSEEIFAMWLIGTSLIALATEKGQAQIDLLEQAQAILTEALDYCRRFHELIESDILLALARCYFIQKNIGLAWEYAKEALAIADLGGYRLKRADIYLLLAQIAYYEKDLQATYKYAQSAYSDALCDGPPYSYETALHASKELLSLADHHRGWDAE